MFRYSALPVGSIQANAYILYDDARDDCLVIDPGAEPEGIRLACAGKRLAAILLTHGHADHTGAVADLRSPEAPVFIHAADAQMLANPSLNLFAMVGGRESQGEPDFCLEEGPFELAGLSIEALHTPGHTPGSCCFQIGDILFTGDTLFRNGVGRTDLPGGDAQALRASLSRLLALGEDIVVCPGHGGETTIGAERRLYR